jgi:hypothetical protein
MALERLDGTFSAGANISIGKAKTAVMFNKPTRFFEELINSSGKGRTVMTALETFTPLIGGIPIVWEENRKIVLRYEVNSDGTLSNGKVFFDMTSAEGEDALDGMKVDQKGNLYVSVPVECGSSRQTASIWKRLPAPSIRITLRGATTTARRFIFVRKLVYTEFGSRFRVSVQPRSEIMVGQRHLRLQNSG